MEYKKTRRHPFLRKLGTLLTVLGVICLAAFIAADMTVRPVLETLLDYKCRTAAERVISDAVFDRLSVSGDGDLTETVKLTFDEAGHVAAVSADQAKINRYKALMTDAVNDGISDISGQTVSISVGTLTGISFLYGMGPKLIFSTEPRGKAEAKLVSSFKQSGINQTIHSIILEVEAVISPMMPGFSKNVELSCEILLAQTVIVGEVPESYSYIVLDQDNLTELADIDV